MTEPGPPAPLPVPRRFAATPAGLPVLLVAAAIAVVLLGSEAAPVGILDAILFNYANNALAPQPLFYFNGWIPVVPQAVAYAVRGLPATLQFALYPLVATAIAVAMLREAHRLLTLWYEPAAAAVLAFLLLLVFQIVLPQLDQLAWCVWPLLVAAICHILRRTFGAGRYSRTGLLATSVALLSNPTAVVLVPLLAVFAVRAGNATLRWQTALLATLTAVWFAVATAFKPEAIHYLSAQPLWSAARVLWHMLIHPDWSNLVPIAAGVPALAWLSWHVVTAKPRTPSVPGAVLALAYLGGASIALFLFSSRAELIGTMPSRYSIVCAMAALLAGGAVVGGTSRPEVRRRVVSAALLLVAVGLTALAATRLTRNLHSARDRFAFAAAADAYRGRCPQDEALANRARIPNIYVTCRPVDEATAAVVRRDAFGNAFVRGPSARTWPGAAAATVQLLAPGR